jgi:uncharacterized protein
MSVQNPLPTPILVHMAGMLNVPLRGMTSVIELLDEGGTVPFIARYRKEATGNLDEVQIRGIEEKLAYFRELEQRRSAVLASIEEQGKLTSELRVRIEAALEKSELEDLYLPYKPKRRTKATIAREKGLEPLAMYLWNQTQGTLCLRDLAATFINAEKGVETVEAALEGARHIVAEMISETADYRKGLRTMMHDEASWSAARRWMPSTSRKSSECTTTTASRRRRSRRTGCSPSAAARAKTSFTSPSSSNRCGR